MKRTIPECRKGLVAIAALIDQLGYPSVAQDICRIVEDMHRVSPQRGRKAKVKHPPLSGRQVMEIRIFARANPDIHLSEIATLFNVNPGRVSEALKEGL